MIARFTDTDCGSIWPRIHKSSQSTSNAVRWKHTKRSLAIRVIISTVLSDFKDYLLFSPVVSCESYQLPPPPKRIDALCHDMFFTQHSTLKLRAKTTAVFALALLRDQFTA
jgi:uncharacterized PurR-regulated membrane protein YhhQ (DUF165 family)